MTIWVDSREHAHAIKPILEEFDRRGVQHFVSKLPTADYMNMDNPRLLIDRKRMLELTHNVIPPDLYRFQKELETAKQRGQRIVILCENEYEITRLSDVINWKNPRLKQSPMAVSGERLFRILSTMQNNKERYSVSFEFCDKKDTGKRIIEILSKGAAHADQ